MTGLPETPPLPPRRRPPRFQPPRDPEDPAALGRLAIARAREHGFVAAGILSAPAPLTWDRFWQWVRAGYAGEMDWLVRDAAARQDFSHILPFTKSVLSVARLVPDDGPGNIARYARGDDYHATVRRGLHRVAADLKKICPPGSHFRVCVDTAPLLEREVALRAGLGFIGRNGLLIIPGTGSHVVLGELLTDVDLGPSTGKVAAAASLSFSECGSCTACLDSCPTSAFIGPALLDAKLCISYLTIEKRSPFTAVESHALGENLFGCDVCQDVCPWNGPPPSAALPAADPREIASLTEEEFNRRFGHTAITRAGWKGLVRNALAVLENRNEP